MKSQVKATVSMVAAAAIVLAAQGAAMAKVKMAERYRANQFTTAMQAALIAFLAQCLNLSSAECQPAFVLEWGGRGNANGQFNDPHGIVVDTNGNVIVADTRNNRIQIFDPDGTFIMKWGSLGAGPGQFNHPHGIGVDGGNNVFVAETGNNRVQVFTNVGVYVTSWGSFGTGPGQFNFPYAVTVGNDGSIYVADSRAPLLGPDGFSSSPGVDDSVYNSLPPTTS